MSNHRIYVGLIFNEFKVISEPRKNKNGKAIWNCLCSCGTIKAILSDCIATKKYSKHCNNKVHIKLIFTKEKCFKIAQKYKRKIDWRFGVDKKSYHAARYHGWEDYCCNHMMTYAESLAAQEGTSWNKEKCKEEALNYKTRAEWFYKSTGGYAAACRKKWIDECCNHMLSREETLVIQAEKQRKWNKESCLKESLKYKTRNEWCKKSARSYNAARRNEKWFNKCVKHMLSRKEADKMGADKKRKWTNQTCIKESLKYKTKKEWAIKSSGSYQVARSNKTLFKQCVKHMPRLALAPFREERCYKRYKALFNKLNIRYDFMKRLSRSSLIEFVIHTDIGSYGLEIKHDDTQWSTPDIKSQLLKYERDGIKNHKLAGIILSSPKGRYGHSLKILEQNLKDNNPHVLIFNYSILKKRPILRPR